jgi:hypothetical protein
MGSPLDTAKDVMSGATTHNRVDAAVNAAVNPVAPIKKKKKKPLAAAQPVYKPPADAVEARQRQIDANTASDRAALVAMQKKQSLRS